MRRRGTASGRPGRVGGCIGRRDRQTAGGAADGIAVTGRQNPNLYLALKHPMGCVGITGPEHGHHAGRIFYAEIVRGGERVEHAAVLLPRVFGIEDTDLGFGRGANGAVGAAIEASQVIVAFPVFTVQKAVGPSGRKSAAAFMVKGRIWPSHGTSRAAYAGGVGIHAPGPDPGV